MNHSLVNFEQSIEFLLHFNRLVFAMGGKSSVKMRPSVSNTESSV